MPKWSDDDPDYQAHCIKVAERALRDVLINQYIPKSSLLKRWHGDLYRSVADVQTVAGKFRQVSSSNPDLEGDVAVGGIAGSRYHDVLAHMEKFDEDIVSKVKALDADLPSLTRAEQLRQICSLTAWAHGEIIRIHPFCNGNGRTARLLANVLLTRYKIPFTLTVKPRPCGDYGACAGSSMRWDDQPMADYLLRSITIAALALRSKQP